MRKKIGKRSFHDWFICTKMIAMKEIGGEVGVDMRK